MRLVLNKYSLSVLLVATILLVSVTFWSYRGITLFMGHFFNLAMTMILLAVVSYKSGVFVRQGLHFKTIAILFLFIPLPGMIGAGLYHEQSLGASLYANRNILFWLTYFVLHVVNIKKEDLIKLMLFVATVWALLTIVQQFTYPVYFFSTRDETKKQLLRAGVYRFMIPGSLLCLFMMQHYYYRYATTKNLTSACWWLLTLVAFYYTGIRQSAIAALLCTFIMVVMLMHGNARIRNLVIMALVVLAGLSLKEILFGEYIAMTQKQLGGGDEDIREVAYRFFLFEYWPDSPWAIITGNGRPSAGSAYQREIDTLAQVKGLFRSDIGIVGSLNQYGILYVLLVLAMLIKGLTIKIRSKENKYLKIYFLYPAIVLVLHESFSHPETIVFICCVMYLIDKALAEEKKPAMAAKPEQAPTTQQLMPYMV